ncbi:MAG: ABC transporter permease, partial [Rhodospirillaceae bacterium]|nr:ABC transporter permease [Rhodospirillaceae bacterium]
MSVFLARRFLSFLITVFGASVIIFLLLEVLPGDPALTMLGVDAPDSAIAAIRLELGLDRPAFVRYVDWIAGLFHGEMGLSYVYKVPVTELIGQRLQVTLPLAIGAMVVATLVSLSLGIFAATNHNRIGDYGVMGFSQLGLAIPDFWFGILLIILFAV